MSAWSANSSGTAARTVKYMANSPAKNMSSLASHTIVPTDTGFGRFTVTWETGREAAVAVDTPPLWLTSAGHGSFGPRRPPGICHIVTFS
ncbi:hypothetical protein Cph01nite_17870 [Cellulomonas phragmiteti]|uniref:Uncharacterized protein n=1 Tax=Cellulomonas phragmiteti TaxID=478780 RepID=A0ABQ4DKZ1_9CELL|nr:hypothetical protein Cph01nite_17870 [Cellulomonas phragmiteti]